VGTGVAVGGSPRLTDTRARHTSSLPQRRFVDQLARVAPASTTRATVATTTATAAHLQNQAGAEETADIATALPSDAGTSIDSNGLFDIPQGSHAPPT